MSQGLLASIVALKKELLELDDKSGLPPFVRDLRHLDELALEKELICSEEQIKKAEENTRAQRNNPLWSKLRHLRLTAR